MPNPDVFILTRAKNRHNSSFLLDEALRERGVNSYRVTPLFNPRYRPENIKAMINYGVVDQPIWGGRVPEEAILLNTNDTVRWSSSKVDTDRMFQAAGVPSVECTTDRSVAQGWVAGGNTVVTRTLTRASQGRGIVLSPPDDLPASAPLYSKLFTGSRVREYRVYIVAGRAIDITEKRRWNAERREEAGIDGRDPYTRLIRAHHNGWAFTRDAMVATLAEQERIKAVAQQAAMSIGMGCGAVDMITNRNRETRAMEGIAAIETNTSVGLEAGTTTLTRFADAIAVAVA